MSKRNVLAKLRSLAFLRTYSAQTGVGSLPDLFVYATTCCEGFVQKQAPSSTPLHLFICDHAGTGEATKSHCE